jgi:hypothetical protein
MYAIILCTLLHFYLILPSFIFLRSMHLAIHVLANFFQLLHNIPGGRAGMYHILHSPCDRLPDGS